MLLSCGARPAVLCGDNFLTTTGTGLLIVADSYFTALRKEGAVEFVSVEDSNVGHHSTAL